MAVLLVGCWTGCAPPDECTVGDFRCDGALLQDCLADRPGIGIGTTHYSHGGPNTWALVADCGSADLCKTPAPVDGGDAPAGRAFCALEPTPEPLCLAVPPDGPTTTVCVATTGVDCNEGFAVARHACAICNPGDCEGKVGDPCEVASECAAGLTCAPNGSCSATCFCPEGASCETCGLVDQEAPSYGGASAPLEWICHAGFCLQR